MKKVLKLYSFLFLLIALCFTVVGCKKDTVCVHNDVDGDGICDICGEKISEACSNHVDNDGDCKCDTCGETLHTDANKDNICDNCGATLGRVTKKIIKLTLSGTSETKPVIEEMVKYYNDNIAQGYSIKATITGSVASTATNMLSTGSSDIVEIDDQYAKGAIIRKYVLDLTSYTESGKLDVSGIYPSVVNRFRLDDNGDVGPNAKLYAVPRDLQPTALYYNATALKAIGVNIISVGEEELDAYNTANGTHYLPHGFYEYTTAPDTTTTSASINGESKYRVFNDQIPMNWEELVTLSSYLTQSYNSSSTTQYGYYSEWWFNYGWSVGGDCVENGADGKLKFTLCDKTPNYLVTSNTIVNGTNYKAGEILSYVDKLAVQDKSKEHLYELPSQYDAFAEFCALSQQKSVKVTDDESVKGYAISPNPTRLGSSSRVSVLTSKLACFVASEFRENPAVKKGMELAKLEWGIAPFSQYREYNEDGTLKQVEGTNITGYKACHNLGVAFAVSAKTKYANECVSFLNWWISEDAQKRFLESGTSISCLKSINENAEFQTTLKTLIGCSNISPIMSIASSSMQGDWSYIEDGTWITNWANCLNTDVRNGTMTIDEFWRRFENPTNEKLAEYKTKKFR